MTDNDNELTPPAENAVPDDAPIAWDETPKRALPLALRQQALTSHNAKVIAELRGESEDAPPTLQ